MKPSNTRFRRPDRRAVPHRPGPFATTVLALSLACSLPACGGGGGLSFGGGIGGTGLVVGPITELGSIFVEDVEFDTTAATVTVDGGPAAESELRLGMVVTVSGEIADGGATGVADTVEFTSLAAGPILAVDAASDRADVLGDVVLVDEDTVLDGVAVVPTDVGVPVRVSGFVDADGTIRATRLEARPGLVDLVFSGVIADLDETAETFRIRRVTVDYSGATLTGVPSDGLRDGLLARVVVAAVPAAGSASARSVRFLTPLEQADAGRKVLLQGVVTSRPGARTFVLDGAVLVRFAAGTEFVGGTAADLLPNTRVRLAGVVDAGRGVSAALIAFPRSSFISPTTDVGEAGSR